MIIHVHILFEAIRLNEIIKEVNIKRKGKRSEDRVQWKLEDEEEPTRSLRRCNQWRWWETRQCGVWKPSEESVSRRKEKLTKLNAVCELSKTKIRSQQSSRILLTRTCKHPHNQISVTSLTSSPIILSHLRHGLASVYLLTLILSHIHRTLALLLAFFLFFQHVHNWSYLLFPLPRMLFLFIITSHHSIFFSWLPTLKYQYNHYYSHLLPFILFHHFVLLTLYEFFDTPSILFISSYRAKI